MLLIDQHTVRQTMPPLPSRLLLQLRLEVVQTLCCQPNESTADRLEFEVVSAVVGSTLALCALGQLGDYFRVTNEIRMGRAR